MVGTSWGCAALLGTGYFCDGVLTAVPQLIYPMMILCGIYAVVVVWVVGRMGKKAQV